MEKKLQTKVKIAEGLNKYYVNAGKFLADRIPHKTTD